MWLEEKSKVIYNQIKSLGLSDADAKKITEIFINELKMLVYDSSKKIC